MKETFIIDISYSQIAIFSPNIESPFNDWMPDHIDAGYSWRHESVSFSTDDDGPHQVYLAVEPEFPEQNNFAIRMLEVTIDISACGQIEIASIADSKVFPLPAGRYQMRFQYVPSRTDEYPMVMLDLKPKITEKR